MLRMLPVAVSQADVPFPWYLLLYAAAITLALGLMRFAWVWLSVTLTILRRKRWGKIITICPRFSIVAVVALAGVKGPVTLASILTLPILLADGSPLPERELLIFLLMVVILVSLIVAAADLPCMTQYLADDSPHDTGKDNTGAVVIEVTINRLGALLDEPVDDPNEQALRVNVDNMLPEMYQRRLHYNDSNGGQDVGLGLAKCTRPERYMQREAIITQHQKLFRLRRARNISDTTFYEVLREIDFKEEGLR